MLQLNLDSTCQIVSGEHPGEIKDKGNSLMKVQCTQFLQNTTNKEKLEVCYITLNLNASKSIQAAK